MNLNAPSASLRANVRMANNQTTWLERRIQLMRDQNINLGDDNVQEVDEGLECGIVLEGYQDVKVGDVLEFFETRQVEQTLE